MSIPITKLRLPTSCARRESRDARRSALFLLKPRLVEADRAAYRDYVAAKEAARLEKHKSLQQIVHLAAPQPI